MNDIKFFLKFGEREHLEDLQKGELYFSNAKTFRYYEEKLLIKGQGDQLEGGSMFIANNLTKKNPISQEVEFSGIKGNIIVHYQPADFLPVFCIFACFAKDCTMDENGKLVVSLSEEQKNTIRTHFPNADTVAIIHDPMQFVTDVHDTIGFECKSELVNYFPLRGVDSEQGMVNDFSYIKYLMQDTPPKREGKKIIYSFNANYIYRALLCKDLFFTNEQEYRFILPKVNIESGQVFHTQLQQAIELQDLNAFLNT